MFLCSYYYTIKTTRGLCPAHVGVWKAILVGKGNFLALFLRLQRLFLLSCYNNPPLSGGRRFHEALTSPSHLWLDLSGHFPNLRWSYHPQPYPHPPRLLFPRPTGGSCVSVPVASITKSHGVTSTGLSMLPNKVHPLVKSLFASCRESSKPQSSARLPLSLLADGLASAVLRGASSTPQALPCLDIPYQTTLYPLLHPSFLDPEPTSSPRQGDDFFLCWQPYHTFYSNYQRVPKDLWTRTLIAVLFVNSDAILCPTKRD